LDRTESDIRNWCLDFLAVTLEFPPSEIHPETKFSQLGLDSASIATFVVALEEWLDRELDPEVVFQFPSVNELAGHLAQAPSRG
jgi:acyl carrier protein